MTGNFTGVGNRTTLRSHVASHWQVISRNRVHLTKTSKELAITSTLVMYTDYIHRFKSNYHTTFDQEPLIVLVLSHMLTHTSWVNLLVTPRVDANLYTIGWMIVLLIYTWPICLTTRSQHTFGVGNVAHNLCDAVCCYILHIQIQFSFHSQYFYI